MTVREMAEQAGVSPATVCRYLNNKNKVSAKLSNKINVVLEANNFHPSSFSKTSNRLIGVSVPDLECGFYSDIMREIIDQASNYNIQIIFLPTLENDKQSFQFMVKELKLDGIIFLEENVSVEVWNLLNEIQLKAVMCGSASIGSHAAMVHINDLAAAYEGTRYLISLGHKKIAFLSDYPYAISVGFQRLAGCRKAMEEVNLEFNENLVRYSNVYYENGYSNIQDLLKNRFDFTAVFAFSDEMAIGAMNALYDNGLRVPEDISVLGFDDLEIASRVRPALTTIHQPLKQIVKKTLDIIVSPDSNMDNSAITLHCQVCERMSCRKIN
jgi:DNA-binding LacI/PurR family transcriptional regulator